MRCTATLSPDCTRTRYTPSAISPVLTGMLPLLAALKLLMSVPVMPVIETVTSLPKVEIGLRLCLIELAVGNVGQVHTARYLICLFYTEIVGAMNKALQ